MAWCHVGHKDGKFAGAIVADCGSTDPKKRRKWKRQVAEFCGDFIADGFEIKTCGSREEYLAFIDGMPMWQRPSGAPAADDLPLFSAAG